MCIYIFDNNICNLFSVFETLQRIIIVIIQNYTICTVRFIKINNIAFEDK